MKPVYLHIGTHATGTTSIQRFLAKADSKLFEQGILYPKTGRPDTEWTNRYGQHKLHWSLVGKHGINDDKAWHDLQQEVDRNPEHSVLVSAEGFWKSKEKEINRILVYLDPRPVHVILYLRPPIHFLASTYKQKVKMGTYSGTFTQLVSERIHRCNYLSAVSRWEKFERVESIDIRLFDKVKKEPGLEASFADAIGIDFKEIKSFAGPTVNTSPPDDLVQIARWINLIRNCGNGVETWQRLMSRVRGNVLGRRWPGRWLAGIMQPFLQDSLVTKPAVKMLRELLGSAHKRFLRKYIPPEDWTYLPLCAEYLCTRQKQSGSKY